MLLFFRRGKVSLRLETRYDRAAGEFLLITVQPDGPRQVERFADGIRFRGRLGRVEAQLQADGWPWQGIVMLEEGWKAAYKEGHEAAGRASRPCLCGRLRG